MPATIGTSVDVPELKAESLPLPESPAKIDEPATATSSPTSSLQEMPQVITPQAHSADDDDDEDSSLESAKNAVGFNIPENDSSKTYAADIRDVEEDSDHDIANKDDTKPVDPESANDIEIVSDDDAKARNIGAQSKSDGHSVQNESVAATCKTNDQSVNSADAKREFIISFQFAPAFD